MKNKLKLLIILILIVILCIITMIIINKKDKKIEINKDFIYIGDFQNNSIEIENNNYIITNYNDYQNKFASNKLTEKDFESNNYVIVEIQYDSCSESDITPVDYKIKENIIDIKIKYKASCGVCAPGYKYYLLPINKSITTAEVNLDFKAINNVHCDSNVSYKPLIYLYPENDINVTVKLGNPHLLTTTYPKYENAWNVLAKPNGDLIDQTGRTYYGLYWEGINNINKNFENGFVVSKEETINFLEEKLKILGMNEKEANEFIIFWLPQLGENKYNLIRFESIDKINEQMPLEISPKPDTIIRVFMKYKPLKKKIEIDEQKLITPIREGFTVVEWGGSLIN